MDLEDACAQLERLPQNNRTSPHLRVKKHG